MRLSVKFLANAYKFMPVPGILGNNIPQPTPPPGYAYVYVNGIAKQNNDGSYVTVPV